MKQNSLNLVFNASPKSDAKRTRQDPIDAWCRHLLVQECLMANTIDNHRRVLRKMLREMGTKYPDHERVTEYMVEVHRRGYGYHHLINLIRTIEKYMAWLGNPISLGRPRKPKRKLKNTLTVAEVAVMLASCRNIRDKAMLAVLADSGMRSGEVCNIKVKDIDFGNNEINVVQGKGQKDGVANITGGCVKILLLYLRDFPRTDDDYLFTSLRHGHQLNGHAIRRVVKIVASRAGIERRVWPHLFRHSLATQMVAAGASPMTVQAQLRHAHIETTWIYVRSLPCRVRADYDRTVPRYH